MKDIELMTIIEIMQVLADRCVECAVIAVHADNESLSRDEVLCKLIVASRVRPQEDKKKMFRRLTNQGLKLFQ